MVTTERLFIPRPTARPVDDEPAAVPEIALFEIGSGQLDDKLLRRENLGLGLVRGKPAVSNSNRREVQSDADQQRRGHRPRKTAFPGHAPGRRRRNRFRFFARLYARRFRQHGRHAVEHDRAQLGRRAAGSRRLEPFFEFVGHGSSLCITRMLRHGVPLLADVAVAVELVERTACRKGISVRQPRKQCRPNSVSGIFVGKQWHTQITAIGL